MAGDDRRWTGPKEQAGFPIARAAAAAGLAVLLAAATLVSAREDVPSSRRSRAAVARVKPGLEKELTAQGLSFGAPVFMRIFKEERELEVWLRGEDRFILFKVYPICTYGFRGLGPKVRQGDGKAPEGFYRVAPEQMNPTSNYHLAFNLGYPNRYDRHHGRTGSALMVHGSCVSIGCYAMTDAGIEEIYALADAALRNGQPAFQVHIFPFRMTDANMEKFGTSEWRPFWENLKDGYVFFENGGHIPPVVEVRNGRYIFKKSE